MSPSKTRARQLLGLLLAVALVCGLSSLPDQAQAATNLLSNGSFSQVNQSTGLPTGWNSWAPAGTTSVALESTAGPKGDPAVKIAASPLSDTTARRAITQVITVDANTPRNLQLSGWVKSSDFVRAGWSGIRIQGRKNPGNITTLPVVVAGQNQLTTQWQQITAKITLPAGTTQLYIEPMLDRSGGALWINDLKLVPAAKAGGLTAEVTASGNVELAWNFAPAKPHHYRLYRAIGKAAPSPSQSNLVRSAYAETLADDTASPGAEYTYLVQALAADGSLIATSDPVTVAVPSKLTNPQKVDVLTAFAAKDGIFVGWGLSDASFSAGPITIRAGAAKGKTTPVGKANSLKGSLTLPAGTGPYFELVQNGKVLDYTLAGTAAHPRSIVTKNAMAEVRAAIKTDPTRKAAWQATLDRLKADDYRGNGKELYKARDAAFAYAVTGDPGYAQTAYQATMAGASFVAARPVNMGLELGRAQLNLSAIYDWAYNGFSDSQRADVRNLIQRGIDLASTYHHDAIDNVDKSSNWIAVFATTELASLLAVRGDGEIGMRHERITYLSNLVRQHLRRGYTDTGYTQEGWDYFHYAGLYMLPTAYAAIGAGHISLLPELQRPKWWNLALHTVSARQSLDTLQFGVGSPGSQTHGILPMLMPLTPKAAKPGLQWIYDTTRGMGRAGGPLLDGLHDPYTVLFYPGGNGNPKQLTAAAAHSAILDDKPGFYAFRSGYTGANDVQVGLNNRNTQHKGWSGSETFGLSLLGFDTTWARMGAKSTNPKLFSVPLVDGKIQPRGQYSTNRAQGRTLASKAYPGQGGGYVQLDGSKNFEIEQATRQAVVDMRDDVTVLAFNDRFSDQNRSHQWDWQLVPNPSVKISLKHPLGADFVFTSASGALTGCVIGDGVASVKDGALRVSQTGPRAQFRIVMAVAKQVQRMDCKNPAAITVAGRSINIDQLASYDPSPKPVQPKPLPPVKPTQPKPLPPVKPVQPKPLPPVKPTQPKPLPPVKPGPEPVKRPTNLRLRPGLPNSGN